MNTSRFPRISGISSTDFIFLCRLLTGFPTQRSLEQSLPFTKGFLIGHYQKNLMDGFERLATDG
jgi:hypothetical protein